MKLIDNILYLEYKEFVHPEGLIPDGTYKSLKSRGKIKVKGYGGIGREVLIEYESLPPAYKRLVIERYGDPYIYNSKQPIRDLIVADEKARQFFENYETCVLSYEDKKKYCNDAAILNAFRALLSNKPALKKKLNISIGEFWNIACEIVTDVKHQFPNTLPTSLRRLKPHYKRYVDNGYEALIDGRKFNETNNKKVDDQLEWLIMCLYTQRYNPYKKEVYTDYLNFLKGTVNIVNRKTGEVFNPEDYAVYGELSAATIWRILMKPVNQAIIDKIRLNALDYSNKHLPYNERHSPEYSLSKLTMDDRDLPFLMPNKERVKAYEVIDVASGCIIGKAFGKDKNQQLLLSSLKDMFRLLVQHDLGIPGEIEFERHLTTSLMDGILKAGEVFPFTRMCRGGNPREKRAEHTYRRTRFTKEIRKEKGYQGRPFARDEANRAKDRESAAFRSFEDIVAIEEYNIDLHNNALHPDQEKYAGMTRWEVFLENVNPNITQLKHHLIAKYIGEKVNTTIRNNKLLRVQYANYRLPGPDSILQFNNYHVTAYYLPKADGEIPEVYVYQDGEYKCTCVKSVTYNESQFEQTDEDKHIMHEQFSYRSRFDAMIRDGVRELASVDVVPSYADPKIQPPKMTHEAAWVAEPEPVKEKIDYRRMAEEDI